MDTELLSPDESYSALLLVLVLLTATGFVAFADAGGCCIFPSKSKLLIMILIAPIVAASKPNVATTFLASVIATVHVPLPVQAPDQPVKAEPLTGEAVRVTLVPLV